MVQITIDLIRKKSEHNEGTMAELEEISLHQLEIEKIEVIGSTCRKLKILYLQNNIIPRIENLYHLKDLEYLNLALNNIKMIEGLGSCEFLKKLDLTVNFISCSALRQSIENLKANKHLKELYVMGNPFSDWPGHKDYIIYNLPWLERLDGTRVTKSETIRAAQCIELREKELDELIQKEKMESQVEETLEDDANSNEENPAYTPELRTAMYREMAEEKAAKEERERSRMPRERNYDKEHEEAVAQARMKQYFPDGRVRQCNEGGLEFTFEEDTRHFYLRVALPKHVDTSLINCEVFPRFVEVVFRNKVLRLALPGDLEAKSDESRCERSQITGELKVIIPKVAPTSVLVCKRAVGDSEPTTTTKDEVIRPATQKSPTLGQQILSEAVNIRNISKESKALHQETESLMHEVSSVSLAEKRQVEVEKTLQVPSLDEYDDDDE